MIIKIDVDGVIRDIITPMVQYYNERFNEHLTNEDITDYDVNKSFPKFNGNAVDELFTKNSEYIFLTGAKVIDNAKEAIDKLIKDGHQIVICTYQKTFENKIHTLEFLERNQIKYDDICFTEDKQMIDCNIMIDDNPKYLYNENDNILKVCVKAPYNLDFNCQNSIVTDSLYDFVNDLAYFEDFLYTCKKEITC